MHAYMPTAKETTKSQKLPPLVTRWVDRRADDTVVATLAPTQLTIDAKQTDMSNHHTFALRPGIQDLVKDGS